MTSPRASNVIRKIFRCGSALTVWGVAAPASVLFLVLQFDLALAQGPEMQYQQLPNDVRHYVESIRESCIALDPQSKPYDSMQGITVVDLDGEGSRDLLVDTEQLCNGWLKGANCNNRGCVMKIWKQVGQQSWKKIFDKNLFRKFISLGKGNRFRLMAVSIYAGDPHCKPDPGKDYTSGQSCDALVFYLGNAWRWEKIE